MTQLGTRVVDTKGVKMVYVPAGQLQMGSTEEEIQATYEAEINRTHDFPPRNWFTNQIPKHPVEISQPFWLDLLPVTNESYSQFVEEGGYRIEALWTALGWDW